MSKKFTFQRKSRTKFGLKIVIPGLHIDIWPIIDLFRSSLYTGRILINQFRRQSIQISQFSSNLNTVKHMEIRIKSQATTDKD